MASTSKMGIVNTTENINSTSDEMIVNMESKKKSSEILLHEAQIKYRNITQH